MGLSELVFGGIGGTMATIVVGYLTEQRQRRIVAALEYSRWALLVHRPLADLLSNLQYLSDPKSMEIPAHRQDSINDLGRCLDETTRNSNFTDVDVHLRLAYGDGSVEVQLLAQHSDGVHEAIMGVLETWRENTRETAETLSRQLNEVLLPRREKLKSRLIARSTILDIVSCGYFSARATSAILPKSAASIHSASNVAD